MVATTALLIASIIASVVAAGAGTASAAINYNAQKEANKSNIELQNSANQTNLQAALLNNQTQLDLAKNKHQYEMADLKAAGLNPVLTAMGGSGASIGALSMPNAQAARVNAPQIDLSGISNALNSMSHLILISKLADERNQTYTNNTNSRNEVLSSLYKRKAESLGTQAAAKSLVNNAKTLTPSSIKSKRSLISAKKWNKLLDDIEKAV